jgi:hypothetical protein
VGRELGTLVIAALRRLRERAAAVLLGLLAAEVGGLGLATAIVRLRAVVRHGGDLRSALAAVGLGGELMFVLGSFGFGLAVVAVARPLRGRALFFPAMRAAGGVLSPFLVSGLVAYASALGLLKLLPGLVAHTDGAMRTAAILALAVTPTAMVLVWLGAAALAGAALVARGLAPSHALGVGFDHVMRHPRQALAMLSVHAALGLALLGGLAIVGARIALLVVAPPLLALLQLSTLAMFDAAIARDPRLATG